MPYHRISITKEILQNKLKDFTPNYVQHVKQNGHYKDNVIIECELDHITIFRLCTFRLFNFIMMSLNFFFSSDNSPTYFLTQKV